MKALSSTGSPSSRDVAAMPDPHPVNPIGGERPAPVRRVRTIFKPFFHAPLLFFHPIDLSSRSFAKEQADGRRQRMAIRITVRAHRLVANGVHEVELATGFAFAGSRSLGGVYRSS